MERHGRHGQVDQVAARARIRAHDGRPAVHGLHDVARVQARGFRGAAGIDDRDDPFGEEHLEAIRARSRARDRRGSDQRAPIAQRDERERHRLVRVGDAVPLRRAGIDLRAHGGPVHAA
ncbi:MAG: hypothetical protein R2752_04260 [Vicinamibacterales bacterium]